MAEKYTPPKPLPAPEELAKEVAAFTQGDKRKEFGYLLKRIRELQPSTRVGMPLPQTDIARVLGVTGAFVSQIEKFRPGNNPTNYEFKLWVRGLNLDQSPFNQYKAQFQTAYEHYGEINPGKYTRPPLPPPEKLWAEISQYPQKEWFGRYFERLRKAQGMSAKEVGQLLGDDGRSRSYVFGIEKSQSRIKPTSLPFNELESALNAERGGVYEAHGPWLRKAYYAYPDAEPRSLENAGFSSTAKPKSGLDSSAAETRQNLILGDAYQKNVLATTLLNPAWLEKQTPNTRLAYVFNGLRRIKGIHTQGELAQKMSDMSGGKPIDLRSIAGIESGVLRLNESMKILFMQSLELRKTPSYEYYKSLLDKAQKDLNDYARTETLHRALEKHRALDAIGGSSFLSTLPSSESMESTAPHTPLPTPQPHGVEAKPQTHTSPQGRPATSRMQRPVLRP